MSDEINLGIRLRRIRDMKGRTIRGLAAKTGISSSLISKIELGKANPSLATLKRITEELEVPMFYLFIENETDGSVVRKEERVSSDGNGLDGGRARRFNRRESDAT